MVHCTEVSWNLRPSRRFQSGHPASIPQVNMTLQFRERVYVQPLLKYYSISGWLRIKYPTRQYAISPQQWSDFKNS